MRVDYDYEEVYSVSLADEPLQMTVGEVKEVPDIPTTVDFEVVPGEHSLSVTKPLLRTLQRHAFKFKCINQSPRRYVNMFLANCPRKAALLFSNSHHCLQCQLP